MKRLHILYIFIVLLSFASCSESPSYSVEGDDRTLNVSPATINASASDNSYELSIDTQYPYVVTTDVDWMSWNGGMRHIVVDDNPSFKERTGYVTVTVQDYEFDVEYSKKVKVVQAGQGAYFRVTSSSFVEDYYMQFTKNGGTQSIVIDTNLPWESDLLCISGEDGSTTSDDWISISPRSGSVQNPAEPYSGSVMIKVSRNETAFTRSAILTIWGIENGQQFWGNPHTVVVTIYQDADWN